MVQIEQPNHNSSILKNNGEKNNMKVKNFGMLDNHLGRIDTRNRDNQLGKGHLKQ